MKNSKVLEEKVIELEKMIADLKKANADLIVANQNSNQKEKDDLAKLQLETLTERVELIVLKKKSIEDDKLSGKNKLKLQMFHSALLNDERFDKRTLEKVYDKSFDKDEVHAEGIIFKRVFLTSQWFTIKKEK